MADLEDLRRGGAYLHRGSPGPWRSLYCRSDLEEQHTRPRVDVERTGSAGTRQTERSGHLTFFTFAAGAVPGLPQRGTAVRLQRGPVDVDLAAVVDDLQPAGALDRLCVFFWSKTPDQVTRNESMNDEKAWSGIIPPRLTYTLQAGAVQRTAHRTQAHKRAVTVPALSVDTGVGQTLVHVCRDKKNKTCCGSEATSERAAGTSRSPSQTSVFGLKVYPLGHWHVKLPGVFLHRPFSHSSLLIRHSSISEGGHKHRADGFWL